MRFASVFCPVVLCLCGCPLGSPRDHSRPHGHQDTSIDIAPTDDAIVFNAKGAGGRDLFLLHLADLRVTRVAETPDYETSPSFSPDGMRLAYAAGIPGDRADHIFTIALDGSSRKQLTHADANDTAPRFSPDGSMIVFARDTTYSWGGLAANWDGGGVICVVDADGTNERQLTADEVFAFAPHVSADGKSVIYFTQDGTYSTPVDGAGIPTRLGPPAGFYPTLSPDGRQVVSSEGRYSPEVEVFVRDLDGAGRSRVTETENGCYRPVLSNAGDRIYFLLEEWPQGPTGHPKSSIWGVRPDGTGQSQVTGLTLFDAPMDWNPRRRP